MVIGITGGIGSGKSTIAAELRRQGYRVYDTDSEAKRLILEDADVREQMIALFGKEVYVSADGQSETYNTKLVAARVFTEPGTLAKLNAIVHPAVQRDIEQRIAEMGKYVGEKMREGTFFIESAILYESGLNRLCDRVVLVNAPEDVRIERTIARDHGGIRTEDTIYKVRARIRAQRKEDDIPADLVLQNDGKRSITDLAQQVIQLQ